VTVVEAGFQALPINLTSSHPIPQAIRADIYGDVIASMKVSQTIPWLRPLKQQRFTAWSDQNRAQGVQNYGEARKKKVLGGLSTPLFLLAGFAVEVLLALFHRAYKYGALCLQESRWRRSFDNLFND
jgi:hypothetical protein